MRPTFLLLFLLAACADQPAPDAGRDAAPAPVDTTAPPAEARPSTKTDTLYLEGMPEPITLRLFDEPAVPFTTYIPQGDFIPRIVSSAEGDGVRLEANFGGVHNPDAYVHFFFPAEGAGLDSLAALRRFVAETMARDNGWAPRDGAPPGCEWAAESSRFVRTSAGTTYLGHVCFAEHGGAPFFVAVQYPQEYAEGFVPRANLLLEALRWRDTGAALNP